MINKQFLTTEQRAEIKKFRFVIEQTSKLQNECFEAVYKILAPFFPALSEDEVKDWLMDFMYNYFDEVMHEGKSEDELLDKLLSTLERRNNEGSL